MMCRRFISRLCSGLGEVDLPSLVWLSAPVSIESCLVDSVKEVIDTEPGRGWDPGARWLSIEGREDPEGPHIIFLARGDSSLEPLSEYEAGIGGGSGMPNGSRVADAEAGGGGGGGACSGCGGAELDKTSSG